jgi:hypothetical protein
VLGKAAVAPGSSSPSEASLGKVGLWGQEVCGEGQLCHYLAPGGFGTVSQPSDPQF